jgi:hypothetical protein
MTTNYILIKMQPQPQPQPRKQTPLKEENNE